MEQPVFFINKMAREMLLGDSPLFHDDVLCQFVFFSFARFFVRATNPGARGIFSPFAPGGPDTFIPVDEQSLAFRIHLAGTCVSRGGRWEEAAANNRRVSFVAQDFFLPVSKYSTREIFPPSLFFFLFFFSR